MSRTDSRVEQQPQAGKTAAPGNNGRQAGRIEHAHLVTSRSAFSPIAEEYKKLKARVMRMTKQEPFRNVLLVTSAVGGEGKSVTAANLALSLARDYDHSVLLIDADTRKPSLPGLLNVKHGPGLTDCLSDGLDAGAALIPVSSGNLRFLPAGRRSENPVELFSSSKMSALLKELKGRYPNRYVIIDTPPVLLFAETKVLSALADGVIFVVREGLAPLEHIVEALDLLKDERLLGVVYNDAGPEGLGGTYPYHSYYHRYERK